MGGNNISDETINRVLQMLPSGWTNSKIADHVGGISPSGVSRIRLGRLRPGPKLAQTQQTEFEQGERHECPGCNRMINVEPCVACEARKWKDKHAS